MKIKNLKYLVIGFLSGIIFPAGSALSNEPLPWQMGLQPAAGSISVMATDLHNLLLVVITAISLFVLFLMIYVCVRFRADRNPNPSKRTHNSILEVMWTVIPVLILVVIAVPSFRLLYYLDKQIEPDMTIKVTGIQWYWNYEYMDDQIAFDSYMLKDDELQPGQPRLLSVDNPLVVPANTKIKMLVTANDVMHSFFVPSLAVQTYALIGRVNEVWIDVPEGEKTYYGQCNQICGVNHSFMPIVVKAMAKDEYQAWLADAKQEFAILESPQPIQFAAVK